MNRTSGNWINSSKNTQAPHSIHEERPPPHILSLLFISASLISSARFHIQSIISMQSILPLLAWWTVSMYSLLLICAHYPFILLARIVVECRRVQPSKHTRDGKKKKKKETRRNKNWRLTWSGMFLCTWPWALSSLFLLSLSFLSCTSHSQPFMWMYLTMKQKSSATTFTANFGHKTYIQKHWMDKWWSL